MHPVHTGTSDLPAAPFGAHGATSTRRPQALLHQWSAAGYLLACSGLLGGLSAGLGLGVGMGLALGQIALAPVAISLLGAAARRYRLASLFSVVGLAACALLTLATVLGPLDGYPLLEQIARSAAGAVCAVLAASAASSSWAAARALWGVPPSPRHLGPGGTTSLASSPAPRSEQGQIAASSLRCRRLHHAGS